MAYTRFYKDGSTYEIDLDIMSRLKELQEAVIQLQELQGVDTSTLATAMAEYESHVAEQAEREEAELQDRLSELQAEMMALNINVPSTLENSDLKDRIEYYEQLIMQASRQEEEGEGES